MSTVIDHILRFGCSPNVIVSPAHQRLDDQVPMSIMDVLSEQLTLAMGYLINSNNVCQASMPAQNESALNCVFLSGDPAIVCGFWIMALFCIEGYREVEIQGTAYDPERCRKFCSFAASRALAYMTSPSELQLSGTRASSTTTTTSTPVAAADTLHDVVRDCRSFYISL